MAATTVAIAGAATFAWFGIDDATELSSLGGYASGIVAAITLFWLAVGQRSQMAELALQREELALQRLAAQQQAIELNNSARIGIMSQVRSLIDDALKVVEQSEVVASEADLSTIYMKGMVHWGDVENSIDPERVIDSYGEWVKIETHVSVTLAV